MQSMNERHSMKMRRSKTWIDSEPVRRCICAVMILFPALANINKGLGSTTLLLLGAAGIFGVVFSSARPRVTRMEKWLMVAFAGYFGSYLLSTAVNSFSGVLETIEGKHFEKEAYLLMFIPLLFLFRRLKLPCWTLWCGLCIGAAAAGLYALADSGWIEFSLRVRGAYNPIMFGCLSVAMAFMGLQGAPYFESQRRFLLILPLAGLLLGIVASVLAGSRGAWIAVPAFILISWVHLIRRIRLRVLVVALVLFVIGVTTAYQIPETGVHYRIKMIKKDLVNFRLGDVTLKNSVGLRLASWQESWKMVKNDLLLGIGPGGYPQTIKRLNSQGRLPYDVEIYHSQPHSIYVAVLVDSGLIGLTFLLAVFFVPLWIFLMRLRRPGGDKAAAFAGLILTIGYIHFGLTETVFGRNLFVSFYVIMLAALLDLSLPEADAIPEA